MLAVSLSTAEPITADVLAWAVEEDGRTIDEIAATVDVDVDELSGWVHGLGSPTRGQLTRLAGELHRPRALFFLPTPPRATSLPTNFRHAPGDTGRSVGAGSRLLIRRARRVQALVSWVLQDSDEPPSDLPLIPPTGPPAAAAAEQVRDWLGLTVEAQRSWRDEYQALREWRGALEARGLLVFQFEIPNGDLRGFSAWDDWAPLVVMSSTAQRPAPRIFTMAHELAHLVTRTDAACLDWIAPTLQDVTAERWCEAFAAALLLPGDAVRAVIPPEVTAGDRIAELAEVRLLMSRFRVSARASALRLIDMGLASQALYAATVSTFVPRGSAAAPSGGGGTPRPQLRLRQYGPGAITTVLDAAERGRLNVRDAAAALKINRNEVSDLIDLARGRAGG